MWNPYNQNNMTNQNQMPMPSFGNMNFLPHYDVIKVNGENGVDTFQMGPNSSVLLLDTTAPIVWLVQTDGAGYKTKIPYDVTQHQQTQPVDINQLQQNVSSLQQRNTQLEEIINAKYQSNDKST